MAKIVWSDRAKLDLKDIVSYIGKDKPRTAQMYANRITEATRMLKKFHLSGRIVPEDNDQKFRELIYGNYRIVYRTSDTNIEIVTIHHSARILHLD